MNLKKSLIFCIILLLSAEKYLASEGQGTSNANASGTGKPGDPNAKPLIPTTPKCNLKFLKLLGLEGTEYAAETGMTFFPSVKSTCCTQKDELMLYDIWITGKAKENLQNKFNIQAGVSDNHQTLFDS